MLNPLRLPRFAALTFALAWAFACQQPARSTGLPSGEPMQSVQPVRPVRPVRIGEHVFERRELPNGLMAVAVRDTGENASIFVVLRVGNRQEDARTTGLAHLVEHALFSGTPTTGADVHEKTIAALGGEGNAFTREDTTTFYDHAIPVAALERVLGMEADRLRNLTFAEGPVLHERGRLEREERNTFQPSDGRAEELEAAVFRVHPYRAGLRDAEGLTRGPRLDVATIRAFYDRYYHPNNVCVVVVAPQEPERVLDAIEAAFGALPRGPELVTPALEPWFDAREERLGSTLPRDKFVLTWLIPEMGDPARPALDVLSAWLGRERLDGDIPLEAGAGGRVDRDLFRVAASAPAAGDFDVRAALMALVERVRATELPADELAEIKDLLADDFASQPLRARPYFSLAATFGVYQVLGHPEVPAEWERAVAAVTSTDVLAAARRYLDPERCVTVVFEGTGAPLEPWPDDPAALQRAAMEAADAGDLERAIDGYTRLLARGPDKMNTVIYLATRGQLSLDLRDFEAAITDFETALEVVDYPAVRELLEDAVAQRSQALRGEFAADGGAPETEQTTEETTEETEEGAHAIVDELRASVRAAQDELSRWRGLEFQTDVVPELVETAPDEKLGGWYEPDTKRLVVVLSKTAAFARGAQLHEIFHALQDQTWDLHALEGAARTTDERRALQGLIEGEAMLAVAELLDYDFEAHAKLPATGEIERDRFEKLYQYGTGLRFVRAVRDAGGAPEWSRVDAVWRSLPRTTSELYHPERYPLTDAPALSVSAPPGATFVSDDVLGEFELRWLLAQEPSTRALAGEFGAGLLADRQVELRLADETRAENWHLLFASDELARRFVTEARAAWEREGWTAERSHASVTLTRR